MGNKIVRGPKFKGVGESFDFRQLVLLAAAQAAPGVLVLNSRVQSGLCRFCLDRNSGKNFGKDINAFDACANTDPPPGVLEPNHRGLAAGPLFFAETEFCRKHQDYFNFAAKRDLVIRV